MELVDPNTQDFQYLTLSQYNGEQNYVRARCEVRKDEPFITDTSNAFVCVESFRLSCAPNEGGIVYQYIPNTYAIQVEKDTSTGTVRNPLLRTKLSHFQLSGNADANRFMRFTPKMQDQDGTGIDPTVSINKLIQGMAQDLNPLAVTQGSVFFVDWNPVPPAPPPAPNPPTQNFNN